AALVEALGGTPEFLAFEYQGAESGLRQGASLTGLPVATGNVVFFTKFQVLFANSAAFENLDEVQRAILREAAAAAQQKAIAERPSEAEAADFWCADGGSIVLASEEQVAAIQAATQPVINQIAQNPEHAEVLAALQALKAATPPTPWADACGSQTVASSNTAGAVWSEGLPPNGTWTGGLSGGDIVRMGVLESKAPEWAGSNVYEFNDGQGIYRGEFLDGVVIVCPFVYEAIEDFFRLTYVDQGLDNYACGEQVDDLQWRLDTDGLH